jgi:hypothetical protein
MSRRDRIALILLGVMALGAGAFYMLVVRGGEAAEPAPTQVASPPQAPTEEAPAEEDGKEGQKKKKGKKKNAAADDENKETPKAGFVAAGRDPFVPLVVAAETTAAGTTSATTGGTGTTTTGGTGTTTGGTGGGGGAKQEPQETASIGGHRVTLLDIFSRNGRPMAQVRVDGDTYTVAEGDTFAGNFKLGSIQGGCANFLYGDQAFTLCEPGERK